MAWILVVGHALNQEWSRDLNKVLQHQYATSELQRAASVKRSVGIQVRKVLTYDWKRLIKGRRRIFALLSFVSFSKLVILVYTGQPVENNTAYARYIHDHLHI
jgi:hypothetical protein